MCGLFGGHKNHKLTTFPELRALNESLIQGNRKMFTEKTEVKEIKEFDSLNKFLEKKASNKSKELKKTINKLHSDINKLVKNKINKFTENIESQIGEYVFKAFSTEKDSYDKMKNKLSEVERNLEKYNKQGIVLSKSHVSVYRALKRIQNDISELDFDENGIGTLIKDINSFEIKVSFNEKDLLKAIRLEHITNSASLDRSTSKNLLSISELNENSSRISELSSLSEDLFELNENQEQAEDMSHLNSNVTVKRGKSLLRTNINPLRLQNSHSSLFNDGINIYPTHQSNLRSSLNNRDTFNSFSFKNLPRLLNKENRVLKPALSSLNIYKPKKSILDNRKQEQKPRRLRRLTTRELSPSSINYELTNKNSTLSIKGLNIHLSDFKKILNDSLTEKKMVNRLVFKGNTFKFDLTRFLKTYFTESLVSKFTIDIQQNRFTYDIHQLRNSLKSLSYKNIHIIL